MARPLCVGKSRHSLKAEQISNPMQQQHTRHGISLAQTAEGALNEFRSVLIRMQELPMQASNGTVSDDARAPPQARVQQPRQ